MEKGSKINYEKRPLPSSPGAQQITISGQESKKGSADFYSEMPKKHVIPGPSGDKNGKK